MRKITKSESIIFGAVLLFILIIILKAPPLDRGGAKQANATDPISGAITSAQNGSAGDMPLLSGCVDTDNGMDSYVKGATSLGPYAYADYCINSSRAWEYYCDNGRPSSVRASCPGGYACVDGACSAEAECIDSDGGNGLSVAGTAERGPVARRDYCQDSMLIVEYSCNKNNVISSSIFQCPLGKACYDGACVPMES